MPSTHHPNGSRDDHRRLPHLIDIETLAVHLGDSVRHLRRLVAEGRIPYVKVGHFIRFDPDQVRRWLDGHCHDASA